MSESEPRTQGSGHAAMERPIANRRRGRVRGCLRLRGKALFQGPLFARRGALRPGGLGQQALGFFVGRFVVVRRAVAVGVVLGFLGMVAGFGGLG